MSADRWTMPSVSLPEEGKLVEVITPNGDQIKMKRHGGLWFFEDGGMYAYFTPTFWREIEHG